MNRSTLIRLGVYVGGILLICIVLFLSIIRQALYAPSPVEQQVRANVSFSQRIAELREFPPTPDHPLYPLVMVRDRIGLWFVSKENKPLTKLAYADKRLEASQRLIDRGRYTLALTTLTKAEKYILSANEDITKLSGPVSTWQRAELMNTIDTHARTLIAMKPAFSDEQKAIIDRLLNELALIYQRY